METSNAVPAEGPQRVEVLPGTVREVEQNLLQLAGEALTAAKGAVGKYMALCTFIRQHQIDPETTSRILKEAGFHKCRISEVNRIAKLDPHTWSLYEKKEIGFKPALQIGRGRGPAAAFRFPVAFNRLLGAASRIAKKGAIKPTLGQLNDTFVLAFTASKVKGAIKVAGHGYEVVITPKPAKDENKNKKV